MDRMQHPSNNAVLGAPAGWDQKTLPCNALPVTHIDWDGVPAVVSFWMPTPEEVAAINAGRPVMLSVVGNTMPPVALMVEGKS
ncbi:hypothetical protein LZ683_21155 [Comamonas testosteroni]|uniref:hypothetical protein n=1 Tax=Comamonas testosteroni TaxID=285 RepID=UPI0023AB1C88|nr:hypothetical protein [Comamonas testosteroni]WEE76630.1 hypothetical protein LZ683_21155 [Comamonas testosteroni]